MGRPADHAERMARARLALDGLSVGDAFGERFFGEPDQVLRRIAARQKPAAPWRWTDDTAMGLSILEVLDERGVVDPQLLAERFAERYAREPRRGYGGGAHEVLARIGAGVPWTEAARALFDGQGSMGNGAAMRVAPAAAYFAADELDLAIAAAAESARPTHAHADGAAGAVAVAIAAVTAWRMRDTGAAPRGSTDGRPILEAALAHTPGGPTRAALATAARLSFDTEPAAAAALLGSGERVLSSDTVPFALWCAARHWNDYEAALWTTVRGLGDRDTTCAIAGGVVALGVGQVPPALVAAREPLHS